MLRLWNSEFMKNHAELVLAFNEDEKKIEQLKIDAVQKIEKNRELAVMGKCLKWCLAMSTSHGKNQDDYFA